MEIYERIRELRKNYLHLSQADFGDKLGVSRSVIKNIELNALARPDQKLSLIKLICKEFSVNEDWLLSGTELELQIVKTYFDLDPNTRKMLINHFVNNLTVAASTAVPKQKTVDESEKEYKKTISNSVQHMDYTA